MIEWTEDLSTGITQIDNDHRQLISCINELENALRDGNGKANLTTALDFLSKYAHAHFAREEAHMLEVRCPYHSVNCNAHSFFAARIQGWINRLNDSDPASLALEVYITSGNWLRQHILNVDCKLRQPTAA